MPDHFSQFIEALATTLTPSCVTNQYAHTCDANAIRRNNLRLYLGQMARLEPRVLLVGEAPGYRGCRLTGVPFTSEAIIAGGVPGLGLFGTSRGYRVTGETTRPCREQTATIVWETLADLPTAPLLWNAFPFHPHTPENELSNRPPTAHELGIGADFLRQIIALFDIQVVIAAGNTAERTLTRIGIPCSKVRHPANGGKRAFVEGVKRET
jgi:uracil-DNA glycosylase